MAAVHRITQSLENPLSKSFLQISLKDFDPKESSAFKPLEQVFIGEKAQRYLSNCDLTTG